MSMISAQRPSITWLAQELFSASWCNTSFFDKVLNVRGEIKFVAEGVIINFTSAPAFTKSRTSHAILYAAMLPVTPMSIFLPFSIIKNDGWVTVVKNITSYLNDFIKPQFIS
jgi:hypothetical protein